MKVSPIPRKLWQALNIVNGEVEDVIKAIQQMPDELSKDDQKEFDILIECSELISEYVLCLTANGEVSQRGHTPAAWNPDTIFSPSKERKDYNEGEDDSEGSEDTDSPGNQEV